MTIYIGLTDDIKEKLKKGIYEPGIENKSKIMFEPIQKFRSAVIQAYNKFNGTCYTDFITGHSKPHHMYSHRICIIESPLSKRFLFPIYEEEFQKICLQMKNDTFEETVDKLLKAEKVYHPTDKSIIYIIPYIKSDWIKEEIIK